MTLEHMQNVLGELRKQYEALNAEPDTRGVLRHCNQIEVRAALQLMEQLIAQEQLHLHKPPGSTGPNIP